MNNRDFELLSAYLDGELKPSDLSRLEIRLKTDPELASTLSELRATRTLLRKLPMRKSPRNFTLTRKMVGQNPPLPRTYPIFRFATIAAAFLLVFSYGVNIVRVETNQNRTYFGMGGGGGDAEEFAQAPAEPAAPPAMTEVEEPQASSSLAPEATVEPSQDEASDAMGTGEALDSPVGGGVEQQTGPAEKFTAPEPLALIPTSWQVGLLGAMLAGLLIMYVMHLIARQRWKN